MKNDNVPNEQDWGKWQGDLDTDDAHKKFAGKSHAEALKMFNENIDGGRIIGLTENLRFMPAVPFRFYMIDFAACVSALKNDNNGASDAASCFLNLVKDKLEQNPDDITPVVDELFPAAEYIAKNQEKLGAKQDIYGNFLAILEEIQSLRKNAKQS